MKLPRHGRRMVYAALFLATVPLGCASSRWNSFAHHKRADSRDQERKVSSTVVVEDQFAARGLPQSTENEAARITLVAAEEQTIEKSAVDRPDSSTPTESTSGQSSDSENSLPLDLGSVLALADGQNPQVGLARERIAEAYAQVSRADVLWLPSLRAGTNYNYHDGAIQDVAGNVINTSRSSAYFGMGSNAAGAASPGIPGLVANFHLSDAIFQPKIARFQASSRQFAATATRNDILSDTAIAYLELLRAERRLAIEIEAREKTNRIAELTGAYARTGQGSMADHDRLLTELSARDGEIARAEEGVQTASPRLAFLIHADPSIKISAHEPFVVPLNLTSTEVTKQELVTQALYRRPELAENRQLVGEACERLQREKYAPLIPSVILGLSYGGYTGGLGSSFANGSDRLDADAIAYWEIRNLGFGEQAIRGEATSRLRQARMREVVALDRVAQETIEAHAQVTSRQKRIEASKPGITAAEQSYDRNLQRIENAKGLPIEALQSVQALAQARRDYLNAVIDYNVAQIKLCRATGWFEEVGQPAHE